MLLIVILRILFSRTIPIGILKDFFLSVMKSFDFQIAAHPVWLAGSTTTLFLSNVGMMKQNKIGM